MSNLRLVYLESDNVDAVVSVLRELQYMPTAFAPALVSAPAEVTDESEPVPLVLDAAAPPPFPHQSPSPAPQEQQRLGVAGTVLAAFEASSKPDRRALARKLYGDDSSNSIQKVGRTVWNLCQSGRLKAIGDGAYKVVG